MTDTLIPTLGIIEGFFGRSWSWEARADYAPFLAQNGYQFYIYAPKSDSYLRKNWQFDWPADDFTALLHLRKTYRTHGVQFGMGLSPFEIYCDPNRDQRALLSQKIIQMNALEPDILCLLFDDMRGDLPDLAQIQCDLVHEAAQHSTAKRIIFCPTYYSFDPILEKVFGARPLDYWQTLGEQLDPAIDIFWTGEHVCSTHYSPTHLQTVAELLKRKPFLWDNYPVNDSAAKSKHLHLRAFGEDHGKLGDYIAGHAVNPMNQPWLSRIPLMSLPKAYHNNYSPAQALQIACTQLCDSPLAEYLLEDVALLQDVGLKELTDKQQGYLLERYQPWSAQNPYAKEICAWLAGDYAFDPACLTD